LRELTPLLTEAVHRNSRGDAWRPEWSRSNVSPKAQGGSLPPPARRHLVKMPAGRTRGQDGAVERNLLTKLDPLVRGRRLASTADARPAGRQGWLHCDCHFETDHIFFHPPDTPSPAVRSLQDRVRYPAWGCSTLTDQIHCTCGPDEARISVGAPASPRIQGATQRTVPKR
jgi:hypothetical protein